MPQVHGMHPADERKDTSRDCDNNNNNNNNNSNNNNNNNNKTFLKRPFPRVQRRYLQNESLKKLQLKLQIFKRVKYNTAKSRHEFKKARLKRTVFSRLLKVSSDSASLIFCGRLFQRSGIYVG